MRAIQFQQAIFLSALLTVSNSEAQTASVPSEGTEHHDRGRPVAQAHIVAISAHPGEGSTPTIPALERTHTSAQSPESPVTFRSQEAITGVVLPLNSADSGVLSPKGFANGGTIYLPRGRYKITECPIVMTRGMRIKGEGRESTQLVSFCTGSVLKYVDAGRYVPDEIAVEDLSIWQDRSVVPTSGAGIEVLVDNALPSHALSLQVRNVLVEGTYRGITLNTGLSASVRDTIVSKTKSDGFYLQHNMSVSAPASSVGVEFAATYAMLAGGHGYNLEWCSYCSLSATSSDSNAGDGYHINGGSTVALVGGAEANGGSCVHVRHAQAINLTLFCRQDSQAAALRDGVTIDHSYSVNLFGGQISAMNGARGTPIKILSPGGRVNVFGTYFLENFANIPRTNDTSQYAEWGRGLITDGSHWTYGAANSLDTSAMLSIVGTTDSTVEAGARVNVRFTSTKGPNSDGVSVSTGSGRTQVAPRRINGIRVLPAVNEATTPPVSTNGIVVLDQSMGSASNSNLVLGTEAPPSGNWSIYSASPRESAFVGPIRIGGSEGPMIAAGKGSPEGAVSAPPGSIFLRTDKGAEAVLYVKQIGTGVSGWTAK